MIKLFTDDTKVFATVNNEEDKNSLQGDIDKLMNWSDTWLLKFNKSKCKHASGTRNRLQLHDGGKYDS